MPQPSASQVHAVDVMLSNMSAAIIQDEALYGVSRRVFPVVSSDKQSNKYYVWDQEAFFRSDAEKRAPGAESAGSGLTLSNDQFYCDVWASHFDIDHQARANADAGIDLERGAVSKVTRDLLIREDQDWASEFFGTGQWGTDVSVAITWDNVNSTPIEDIRAQWYVIAQNTGQLPNSLVLGPNTYKRLQDHPDILDRIKYTQTAIVTQGLIASVLDLQRVEVLFGVRNTAAEGAAGSYSFNAGNHALLVYAAPAPGLYQPSAGYTFTWSGLNGNAFPIAISRFDIPEKKVERIEGETAFDYKRVSTALGKFFLSAVAS